MEPAQFIARHPRVFHMAEAGAWESVREHGLLSTTALLDLYGYEGSEREAIESKRRQEIVTITNRETGATAEIRDNKPLRPQFLEPCLDGMTMREWYELLNRKVFFWVTESRLDRLLQARAYRNRAHDVITIDTAALLARGNVPLTLAPINTGATLYPTATRRGAETFKSIGDYPLEEYIRWRGAEDAIVELAIEYALPNVEELALRVEQRRGNQPPRILWQRD